MPLQDYQDNLDNDYHIIPLQDFRGVLIDLWPSNWDIIQHANRMAIGMHGFLSNGHKIFY